MIHAKLVYTITTVSPYVYVQSAHKIDSVCVCVCVCVYICIYMRVCVCVCISVCVYADCSVFTCVDMQEVKRNAHGTCQLYSFDPDMEPFTYPSPWPQVFPDVAQCTVR